MMTQRLDKGAAVTLLVAVCVAAGCGSSDDRPAGIGNCTGTGCTGPGGSSAGGGDSGSDVTAGDTGATDGDSGDSDVPVATLSGQVVRLADVQFQQPLPYAGFGRIQVPTPSGDAIVPFGGDAGNGYEAENVVVGNAWFSVVPDASLLDAGVIDGAVFPTWSYLAVPAAGSSSFDIPVVDLANLQALYFDMPVPTVPKPDAAQVVIAFERQGDRLPDVTLVGWPSSEAVAYDLGAGYSTEATATGATGVAILINTIGTGKVQWSLQGGGSGSFTLVHVPGQATFATIEVP